jgi:phospholipase/lecithinase/hemolysin
LQAAGGKQGDTSMRLARIFIAVTITSATSFAAGPAVTRPFDSLWVFGDSTVDTGWYNFLPSGENQFDQYLSEYNLARPRNVPPTYGMGKATSNPGPISVEVLASVIDTDVLPADQVISPVLLPSTNAEAVPNNPKIVPLRPHGTNYATGGARNHDLNPPGIGLFPNAVPTETQIANYLAQFTPDGSSLYVISSGGNDVSYAVNNNIDDKIGYLTGAADSLAATIATLQQGGARFIIVTNLPESFGTNEQKMYRQVYNSELMSRLTNLGVSYAWADMNNVRLQIVANPARFGIAHTANTVLERACTTPAEGLGVTSGWAYLCSPSSPVSKPISDSFAEQALFSDNEHWATGGHNILGSYYFCLAVSTWPSLFGRNFRPIGPGGFIPPGPQPPTPCSTFRPIVEIGP